MTFPGGKFNVKLRPQWDSDMWILYENIQQGDLVRCLTSRKVHIDEEKKQSRVIYLKLTIQVEKSCYMGEDAELRLSGIVVECSEKGTLLGGIKGRYHTIIVKYNMDVFIEKEDAKYITKFKKALHVAENPHLIADKAALMVDKGYASLYTFRNTSIKFVKSVSVNIPKNRRVFSVQDAAYNKFFKEVRNLLLLLDVQRLRTLMICGPGSTKNMFIKYMQDDAATNNNKKSPQNNNNQQPISADAKTLEEKNIKLKSLFYGENTERLMVKKTANSDMSSLEMLLVDDEVIDEINEVHQHVQIKAMDDFQSALNISPKRICYTFSHVEYALTVRAPETIIISDMYHKSPKVEVRKKFQKLHEDATAQGVDVVIAYSGHHTYEAVNAMGGICSILRYKIEDEAYPALEL